MKLAIGVRKTGFVFLALGAALFVKTVVEALTGCTYYGNPRQIEGKVVRFEDDSGRSRDRSADTRLYSVVEFALPPGSPHEVRTTFPQYLPDFALGQAVKVSYLDARPGHARIATTLNIFYKALSSCVASNVAFMAGCILIGFESMVSYFNTKWRGHL